jgi:hypothetical protein
MKTTTIPAFALALALAACADNGGGAVRWYKTGATQADFQGDAYDCERDARAAFPYAPWDLVVTAQAVDMEQRCMVARGWAKGVAP